MLCPGASRPETEDRVKPIHGPVLNIVQTETDSCLFSTLLMVLLILSKGAQRRKNGEKRKDRKKEATEEEKGCSEKQKLVVCRRDGPQCTVLSLPALCKLALNLPLPPGGLADSEGEQRFAAAVATLAPAFMCLLRSFLVC